MILLDLVKDMPVGFQLFGDGNTEITSLSMDSRQNIAKGTLFFCVSGLHMDAHNFAPDVVKRGASALIVERKLDVDCPQVVVENVRHAMSYIASAFHGNPSRKMKMLGITGTKGKTTTSFLLKSILEKAGHKVGLIGTVCTLIGDKQKDAGKTTPDPIEFQELLHEMADEGVEYVVMEVSAHALHMHRIAGVVFEAAAFTNLSVDHLDYFKTMENYLEAKLLIRDQAKALFINCDDEAVLKRASEKNIDFVRFGIRAQADIYAREIEFAENGLSFTLCYHKRKKAEIKMNMTGIFNVYNALTAASIAESVGVDIEDIKKGLEAVKAVPGRIELLDTKTPYRVILDYAHSPDALENILNAVRPTTKGRLICLFGCGGGRDQTKRPIMGEISGRLSDFSIITSDNPRNEEPMVIIDSIVEGIAPTGGEYVVIENRREAIRYALSIAKESDAIVLAGKGHETYQEICGVKHPFDEKVIVAELLEEAGV
ncbi:MAG: UDP-N-acetylmuramoyl-L-alanyl-D-glutamate--2,6-diaminopimelate ligase [Clostridia bacterium]|nr:UDP-N-acetylmuramoyl-L-alanyl-D-glutamate--2,6-diaminopimelate ligase [Clostridia bacterium]